jgi:hypothetical protein
MKVRVDELSAVVMAASVAPESAPRGTTTPSPRSPDSALEAALADLVAAGTLTAAQADAVRVARTDSLDAARTPVPAGRPHRNPLPEILGYVGAALVASALLNLLLQSWEAWSGTVRLVVVATATVTLYVAGLGVAAGSGWRSGLATGPEARRRLVALLMALGAGAAAITTGVLLDTLGLGDRPWVVAVAGAVAFTAASLGAWFVRGVLSTLAVAGGAAVFFQGVAFAIWPDTDMWLLPILAAVAGGVWLLIAPRLLAVPVLSEALGWGWMVFSVMPFALWSGPGPDALQDPESQAMFDAMQTQAWVGRGVLIVLALVGMLGFLRGGRWPWAAGGVASGVLAALAIGGQTLSWIMALLVAGVVLLLLSAVLVVVRRRTERRTRAAPG